MKQNKLVCACLNLECAKAQQHVESCVLFGFPYPARGGASESNKNCPKNVCQDGRYYARKKLPTKQMQSTRNYDDYSEPIIDEWARKFGVSVEEMRVKIKQLIKELTNDN